MKSPKSEKCFASVTDSNKIDIHALHKTAADCVLGNQKYAIGRRCERVTVIAGHEGVDFKIVRVRAANTKTTGAPK